MKIDAIGFHGQVDNFVSAARLAADQGFESYWLTWAHGMDPLVAIAIASRELPSMKFGTSVIPNVPFHPLALAMAAMTTSQVSQGRLTLGIGASHRPAVEDYYRLPWQPPVRRMREFLDVLLPLMQEGKASVDGQLIGCHVGLEIQAPPPSVMLAALGPKMLELAGSRVDGTVTWMTGPKTLANHTVPTIRKAAQEAGRPAPEIVCAFPLCVTDDPEAARAHIARQLIVYPKMPSYKAMLDREEVEGPADLAFVGDADHVEAGIRSLFDAGATRLMASEVGSRENRAATRELLTRLIREG